MRLDFHLLISLSKVWTGGITILPCCAHSDRSAENMFFCLFISMSKWPWLTAIDHANPESHDFCERMMNNAFCHLPSAPAPPWPGLHVPNVPGSRCGSPRWWRAPRCGPRSEDPLIRCVLRLKAKWSKWSITKTRPALDDEQLTSIQSLHPILAIASDAKGLQILPRRTNFLTISNLGLGMVLPK